MSLTKVRNVLDVTADTMADLLSMKHKKGSVQLLGFHERGDGGGGVFYWDADEDKANHNGGTIVDPSNDADLATWDTTEQTTWFDAAGVGTGCWKREYSGAVNVKWFGAKGDYTTTNTDNTPSFNAATRASATHSEEVQRISIYSPPGSYGVYGKVYVRKGQSFFGDGVGSTRLFLGGTGSIVMGKDITGADDPGGAPPHVRDIFLEGGNEPIYVTASGWSVTNVFMSYPSSRAVFGGSDGKIIGCTLDNGSGLMRLSGGGHTISDCSFYVGATQITIWEKLNNTVISNCAFFAPKETSIKALSCEIRNVTISNCTFAMNEQFATHESFVKFETLSGFPSVNAEMSFNNCSFSNGKEYAFDVSGGLNHKIHINNCVISGKKASDGFAQSTTSKGVKHSAVGSYVSIKDTIFTELHLTPIIIDGANVVNTAISGVFKNNSAAVDIVITNTNSASTTVFKDIEGDNKQLFSSSAFGHVLDFSQANLKNWFAVSSNATYKYVQLPYIGASLFDVEFIAATSGGSTQYITVETYKLGIQFGSQPTPISSHVYLTDNVIFANAGQVQSTIDAGFTLGGTNILDGVSQKQGDVFIFWPVGYTTSKLSIQPKIMQKF